jgi:hypothetical protein
VANEYATKDDLKAYLKITDTVDDVLLTSIATTSSRAIDIWCKRKFWQDGSVVARTLRSPGGYCLEVPDISTSTGLIVKVDDDGDGVFETTISSTDYELDPSPLASGDGGYLNGIEGWPFTEIRLLNRSWPYLAGVGRKRRIQITAKWGWAAAVPAVFTAAEQVGADLYNRKDAPFGVRQNEFGPIYLSPDAFKSVTSLLKFYRRDVFGQA